MDYSISIYKDKKGNILIIPSAIDEIGLRRNTKNFIFIDTPDNYLIVGEKVIESFKEIIKESHHSPNFAKNAFELATGIKSFKAFSKDRLMVSGCFRKMNGYSFTKWNRYPDGSYGLNKGEGITYTGDVNATEKEVGNLVMIAFNS